MSRRKVAVSRIRSVVQPRSAQAASSASCGRGDATGEIAPEEVDVLSRSLAETARHQGRPAGENESVRLGEREEQLEMENQHDPASLARLGSLLGRSLVTFASARQVRWQSKRSGREP